MEEAIVGGLVYALLPSTVEKYIPDLPDSLVESDIKTKIDVITSYSIHYTKLYDIFDGPKDL